jgi:serine/threonine protein kinase/ABC-type branched-subunit amino acid transport system substrate-binding protein
MKCPFCGTNNAAGETFCINCGGYLDSSPPTVVGSNPVAVSNPGAGSSQATATTTGGSGVSGTLTPNARLQHGRYIVDKILGQGGMGAAVLARDTRVSNKTVVIKELLSDSPDPAQRQKDVRDFEHEVATLATLDHPLVPAVTDSFQEGSRYFMVQEYVPGENLEKHMERLNKPMPEQEALTYASQVLDVLDYLSQQKPPIIHRDIKPANIIIGSKDKRAHLVDFGIARADVAKHAQHKQTSALGTPGYAPPEQYQGNADGRSDLYALAATIHHLVTNRDPRNYPPFSYPLVRTLNSQLSPDIERVLDRALNINANNRYQNAAAMKHDIDEILARRFHTTAGADPYTLSGSMSGPIVAPPPRAAAGARMAPPPPPPPYPPSPQQMAQQVGGYPPAQPRQQKSGNNVARNFILLVVVVLLIGGVFFVLPRLTSRTTTGGPGATATPASPLTPFATVPTNDKGIGVIPVNGEPIGISDGTIALDTNRATGETKRQAAENLKNNNSSRAEALYTAASRQDTRDAEALIYLENLRVQASGDPYITLVVATMITGDNEIVAVGRDMLQGVYIAQKQYNANSDNLLSGTKVRILIANTGSKAESATVVAEQIVRAAQQDKTIVGVVGWPYSSRAINAVPVLTRAKIPAISSTASSDALTGRSRYFFRVAPPDTSQAGVGAKYASDVLKAKNVVVFEDNGDAYSQSLSEGFKTQFKGTTTVINFEGGNRQSVLDGLQKALSQTPPPDLIYFAGYSGDASAIMEELPKNPQFPDLKILGGDALYSLSYPPSARPGFNRLRFTAFAYPDEWDVLNQSAKKPAFFTDYGKVYDPGNKQKPGTYGYNRPTYRVILGYDAALTMLTASGNILATGKKDFTPDDLRTALTQITGAKAIQGASGQIAFNSQNDPADKAVLILFVSPEGFVKMENRLGAGKLLP